MKILIFNCLNLFDIQSFYSNSYNPFSKDDEGKIIISEEERNKKENELKEQFLNELVIRKKIWDSTLEGYNGTIFEYCQTGTGKS